MDSKPLSEPDKAPAENPWKTLQTKLNGVKSATKGALFVRSQTFPPQLMVHIICLQ